MDKLGERGWEGHGRRSRGIGQNEGEKMLIGATFKDREEKEVGASQPP